MVHSPTQIELIWREGSQTKSKRLSWRHRPATTEAIAEWIEDYFYILEHGYQPPGYENPPRPHCARVITSGTIMAEWHLSPKRPAESPVTAEPLGRGGIPAAVPSAPSSECLVVPTNADPRSPEIQSDVAAIRRMSPELTRAVLTME